MFLNQLSTTQSRNCPLNETWRPRTSTLFHYTKRNLILMRVQHRSTCDTVSRVAASYFIAGARQHGVAQVCAHTLVSFGRERIHHSPYSASAYLSVFIVP